MLLATGTLPQLQPETPVVCMQEQTLPVRDFCCPRDTAAGQESPRQGLADTPAATHPCLGIAVAGADDGSRLLDHLQDGSPVDIPRDVGIVWAHNPAEGGT